ncbi:hypothetical protein SLS60_002276 [Paraconiothyrium brasiliense]|uniref:Uncharacterized protein n=1 Tax=Paraconiothyrium brasiliense TaxID=300254 RepID=A0ABR3S1P5_9PLEO
MPVTTRVAPVEVMPAPALSTFNSTTLFQHACSSLWKEGETSVIDSSFPTVIAVAPTRPFGVESPNGFVGTILDAYRMHNHVALRPEDVWFSILTQFNFYVNAHAEQLREHFVDHAGKKVLSIEQNVMNFPAFLSEMTNLLHDNIKDPNLRDWIMPNFTTTTETDKVTASIIMMGTLHKYFVFFGSIICGIPSVTLLGEETDWQNILDRLDFLSTFAKDHPELVIWQSSLKGIVRHMVQTFKAPDSPDVVRFWQRAVHSFRDDYSGVKQISGWVLAFCYWDTDGKLLSGRYSKNYWERMGNKPSSGWWLEKEAFHSLEWKDVPAALVSVPIHFDNLGDKFVAKAVAGSVGYTVRDSEQVFQSTRQRGERVSDFSGSTLFANPCDTSIKKQSFFIMLARKFLCTKSSAQIAFTKEKKKPIDPPISACEESTYEDRWRSTEGVPQLSDLSELNGPWAYEQGGESDTLQPITGWWVIRTSEQYGRDPDVPDVQFDPGAEDYDKDLAENGRPLRERTEL